MAKPTRTPGWSQSAAFRAIGRAAITAWNLKRATLPTCTAKAKRTGEQCRQLPMTNGKCRFHGGATPRGDKFHVTSLPSAKGPDGGEKKLQAKLRQVRRDQKRREARLAAMTPAERERHDAWHKARQPGPAAPRAEKRRQRAMAKEIRQAAALPEVFSPEAAELQRKIDRLEALLAASSIDTADIDIFQ
ncbi:HGGxSTG domain-containing protein [Rhizobium sp. NFR03]|uniref:HGGxSTG domain-containing protein n=1 Tax=Rhizobium sp. NFR03 TaxID=1566263 RepID=UPI0008BD5427|nr:HGGxSTG domain-containing protein [Rhizobium sp. NFR03]SES44295.1 hypothetical protein SAMN03159406_04504 [Rhizobium sp. NFR03]